MTTLKALLISDGRPGHYHLAEGILAAIGRLRGVETLRLEVRRPRWLPTRVLSTLTNCGLPSEKILRYAYRTDVRQIARVDVIVSAGGDTLAANVAAAAILKAPNIFYGSLRRYRPQDFALVLTSYENRGHLPRHLTTLKPHPTNPDTLPALTTNSSLRPRTAGLLIGGDAGRFRYSAADWRALMTFLAQSQTKSDMQWLVSNSRRTPAWVSDELAGMAERQSSPVSTFIDVRTAGPGTLTSLFERAEAVLCTADSSSMISEAIWLRRPVLAIAPRNAWLPENETHYRAYLQRQGWMRNLAIAELTPENVASRLAEVTPLVENPLDILADHLRQRLPALFGD